MLFYKNPYFKRVGWPFVGFVLSAVFWIMSAATDYLLLHLVAFAVFTTSTYMFVIYMSSFWQLRWSSKTCLVARKLRNGADSKSYLESLGIYVHTDNSKPKIYGINRVKTHPKFYTINLFVGTTKVTHQDTEIFIRYGRKLFTQECNHHSGVPVSIDPLEGIKFQQY